MGVCTNCGRPIRPQCQKGGTLLVAEIREQLKARGLSTVGIKKVLAARLQDAKSAEYRAARAAARAAADIKELYEPLSCDNCSRTDGIVAYRHGDMEWGLYGALLCREHLLELLRDYDIPRYDYGTDEPKCQITGKTNDIYVHTDRDKYVEFSFSGTYYGENKNEPLFVSADGGFELLRKTIADDKVLAKERKEREEKERQLAKEREEKERQLAKEREEKERQLAKEREEKERQLAKEREEKERQLAKEREETRKKEEKRLAEEKRKLEEKEKKMADDKAEAERQKLIKSIKEDLMKDDNGDIPKNCYKKIKQACECIDNEKLQNKNYTCHDWTDDDRKYISDGHTDKKACQRHGYIFTKGRGNKKLGCPRGCHCCKPL